MHDMFAKFTRHVVMNKLRCDFWVLSEHCLLVWFQDLGSSAGSKRPTCVILIKPHQDYQDAYNECMEEVSSLPKPL